MRTAERESEPMTVKTRRTARKRILIVDDEPDVVAFLAESLRERGYEVGTATSGADALASVRAGIFELVLADVEMPGMRGPDLMRAVHAVKPEQLVMLMTAFGSIDLAVASLRDGACDFVTKPFTLEVLEHGIERALRERSMRRELVRLKASLGEEVDGSLVGRSPPMRRALDLARRAAQTDSTVMLTGESGTGKGAIARFIHAESRRGSGPFVQLNCAAVPVPLFESELFGVRRGAFTDAREDRPGLFAQASSGTLFLDEIGEMPLESQPKLLQALETGRVRAVGAATETAVDLRLIAATNRPLEEALRERRFRPDLYYRLNVIRIELPPLRERFDDMDALVSLFLDRASAKLARPTLGISADALRWLRAQPWPGNLRELSNVLERAVALAEHDTVTLADVNCSSPGGRQGEDVLTEAVARRLPLADVERAYIRKMLESASGNRSLAARMLGIDRRTLYRKLGEPDEDS